MVCVPCYRFIRRKSETPLEVVWTIVPAIVLVVLSFILIESPKQSAWKGTHRLPVTQVVRLPLVFHITMLSMIF